MNVISILFVLILSFLLLRLPKKWAPLPFIMAACYMTYGQRIELGPLTFTVLRIIVAIGVVRIIIKDEKLTHGFNRLDWLMIIWACWALIASGFHTDPSGTLINRLGRVYNTLGIYFLIRCFCQSEKDVRSLVVMIAILLIPLATEMFLEQLTHRNLFSFFGGIPEVPQLRHGRFRSQGPFHHAILAGTVGAVCAPLMFSIWRKKTFMAMMGLIACLVIVITSASSGPLMSLIFAIAALIFWRWRNYTWLMRSAAVFGYLLLDIVMRAPPYFLIARIDVAGGSTGWHRARLIQSAFSHIGEWWLAGTDYTRHWMPTGVSWSSNHTDITNYYIHMGVIGGLPLMLIFIAIVWKGFKYIGLILRMKKNEGSEEQFIIWALGSSLFAHAATAISVSYFDQSFIFIYMTLAIIASLFHATKNRSVEST